MSRQKPTLLSSAPAMASQSRAMRVEAAGHGALPAGGVLDQHRHRAVDALDRLAPAVVALDRIGARGHVPAVHDQALRPDLRGRLELLVEQLAAGDPDPVVRRRDVDHVVRVHVGIDPGRIEGRPQARRGRSRETSGPSSPADRRGRTGPRQRRWPGQRLPGRLSLRCAPIRVICRASVGWGRPDAAAWLAEAAVGDAEAHADERGDDAGDEEDPLLPGRRVQLAQQAQRRTPPCPESSPPDAA